MSRFFIKRSSFQIVLDEKAAFEKSISLPFLPIGEITLMGTVPDKSNSSSFEFSFENESGVRDYVIVNCEITTLQVSQPVHLTIVNNCAIFDATKYPDEPDYLDLEVNGVNPYAPDFLEVTFNGERII